MTLFDAATEFLMYKYAAGCRHATLVHYKWRLRRFAEYASRHGSSLASELTGQVITSYLEKERRRGLKSTTLHTMRAILLSYARWLSVSGHTSGITWNSVPTIICEQSPPRFLSPPETERFIYAARHLVVRREKLAQVRDVAMMMLLLDTGLRAGELLQMQIQHFDIDALTAVVLAEVAKNREQRRVYFGGQTAKAIAAYLALRSNWNGPMWIGRQRGQLKKSQLSIIVKQIASAAGLAGVHVHTLRHTAATLLLRNGMPIQGVQRILGHKDIKMTMRYTHLIDEDIKEQYISASPVDRLLKSS